ncbi:hypothetical protein [uncultured Reyranella sp.]|uniref:hypothetical protein n=1 Tax=uncultured Reyranella sp. TaxID=735512 RepID=UPI00259D1339|nr:hypothetical protein [uncultured Reyranella sp.]
MVRLEAVAREPFHASVNAASEAITRAGGWVSGHSLLSDAMAVLDFEISGDRLCDLIEELRQSGVKARPSNDPQATGPADGSSPTGGKEVAGRLTLFFVEGRGDLRREVPPFT